MEISSKTDKGLVRVNNEDSLLVIAPWDKLAISKKACLFVVCDGMGGQNAGEVASGMTTAIAKEWFGKNCFDEFNPKLMEDFFILANEKVWEFSQKHPESHRHMGTTCTAIMIKENKGLVCHIGDSRLYRLRDKELTQLTRDHSIVGELVRKGKLTLNEARVNPMRGTLSKALGARQFSQPDVFEIDVKENDKFVLCTDGIHSMMDCEKLESLIKTTPTKKLASTLINTANEAGGKDNSTAIAFKIKDLPIEFPSMFSLTRLIKLFSNPCSTI